METMSSIFVSIFPLHTYKYLPLQQF